MVIPVGFKYVFTRPAPERIGCRSKVLKSWLTVMMRFSPSSLFSSFGLREFSVDTIRWLFYRLTWVQLCSWKPAFALYRNRYLKPMTTSTRYNMFHQDYVPHGRLNCWFRKPTAKKAWSGDPPTKLQPRVQRDCSSVMRVAAYLGPLQGPVQRDFGN